MSLKRFNKIVYQYIENANVEDVENIIVQAAGKQKKVFHQLTSMFTGELAHEGDRVRTVGGYLRISALPVEGWRVELYETDPHSKNAKPVADATYPQGVASAEAS